MSTTGVGAKPVPEAPPAGVKLYWGWFKASGMLDMHFELFQECAAGNLRRHKSMELVILVRSSNVASLPGIEKDYPAKPFTLKIKTSKATGFVTCQNDQHGSVRDHVQEALKAGFLVVGSDGVARDVDPDMHSAKPTKQVSTYDDHEYKPQKYEVIDPDAKLPIVSDYDLLGVYGAGDEVRHFGVVKVREDKDDIVSPFAQRVADDINQFLADLGKRPRVMHGAHEDFDDLPDGGIVGFFPSGEVMWMPTREYSEAYYLSIGRQSGNKPHEFEQSEWSIKSRHLGQAESTGGRKVWGRPVLVTDVED